jgi:rhodanese-related sulfurtransferase
MGPFVPDLISDQLNLVVALILGIAFGYVLEQAGFSSSRRLAGVFYGYDFTVLRVFFTAAVTAMSGVLLLGYFGLLDVEAIYVNPTWLWPAIVGGAIMGVGFVLGGYCPGTSICAAAIGKVDAMFFVGGGLLGVFAFGEMFSLYNTFFNSTALGPVKVFDSLGISSGLFAFILIAVAVFTFAVTTIIERKVNSASLSREFNLSKHRMAAIGILFLGLVFLILPERKAYMINTVSDASYIDSHPVNLMPVDELAYCIVDGEPNIQIVDVRNPDQFAKLALPGSRNISFRDFFSKDNNALFSQRHMKKVLVADDEAQEKAGCLLLKNLGYDNVAALEGGLPQFKHIILDSTVFVPTGSRWDNDVRSFRETARVQIASMIEAAKHIAPKVVKAEKKIVGGC